MNRFLEKVGIGRLLRQKTSRQFFAFCLVGVVNTLLNIIIYRILIAIGVYYWIAWPVGYCVGLINSYILNSVWTFAQAEGIKDLAKFARFVVVNVFALGAGQGAVLLSVESGMLSEENAVLPAVAVSVVVNFTGNKLWTFADREK
jgi:putative flippase GtrA